MWSRKHLTGVVGYKRSTCIPREHLINLHDEDSRAWKKILLGHYIAYSYFVAERSAALRQMNQSIIEQLIINRKVTTAA